MNLTRWIRYQWDRALAVGLVVLGSLALLLGYLGLSRNVYPAQQLPYILSGGMVGLFLLGIAGTLWLSADMQDEWRQLRALEEAVRGGAALDLASAEAPTPAAAPAIDASAAGSGGRVPVLERS
jgi:hypothetical protein